MRNNIIKNSIFIVVLFLNQVSCAQKEIKTLDEVYISSDSSTEKIEPLYDSELVLFKNINFIKKLEEIIIKENSCKKIKKNIDWYIEFKDSKEIIITHSRISNLYEIYGDSPELDIYTTIINNQIVFVLLKNNDNRIISKTGLKVNLSNNLGKITLAAEHYSYWIVENNMNTFKIIGSKIINCQ